MLYLKGGNHVKINVLLSDASQHDAVLKSRTVIGTLHLVRSVTSADVEWKVLEKDPRQENISDQITGSESAVQSTTYQEGLVPNVALNDNLTDRQKQIINQMLISEQNAFCQDNTYRMRT